MKTLKETFGYYIYRIQRNNVSTLALVDCPTQLTLYFSHDFVFPDKSKMTNMKNTAGKSATLAQA